MECVCLIKGLILCDWQENAFWPVVSSPGHFCWAGFCNKSGFRGQTQDEEQQQWQQAHWGTISESHEQGYWGGHIEALLIVGILASSCYCMLLLATYAMRQIVKGNLQSCMVDGQWPPTARPVLQQGKAAFSVLPSTRCCYLTLVINTCYRCQIKRRRHLSFWEDSMHVCKSYRMTSRQGAKSMMFF